jgi:hypothetical protein
MWRMKKLTSFLVLAFLSMAGLPPGAAAAEDILGSLPAAASPVAKPVPTDGETITLLFSKLTRRAPDFDSMIRQTEAYKAASSFEQPSIIEKETEKLKEAYRLLSPAEPIVVETQVKLSSYNASNRGFFVENFKTETFFPVSHNGTFYAIVPRGIVDKQWLKIEDPEIAKAIQGAANASRTGMLTMVLRLLPRYADASSPVTIDGTDYWPIAADIKEMALYAPEDGALLWQSNARVQSKAHESILNLYQ